MILTTRFLNEMFRQWGDHIDKPLETYLLATYEEEPFPYEWSEQDLYEQIRKLIFQYEQGMLDILVPTHQERQRLRYDDLKESYLELLQEAIELRKTISGAAELLGKNNPMSSEDSLTHF
jgi:hypothetical protein